MEEGRGKQVAEEWRAHCVRVGSLAWAESNGSHIILKTRRFDMTELNLRSVAVLESGLEVEGSFFKGFGMPQIIEDDIDDHISDWVASQDAKERRRSRDGI